jgi:hypothetical protein
MRLVMGVLAVVVFAGVGAGAAGERPEHGVVVSGGPEHGSVLLRTPEGFSLLVVDSAVVKRSAARDPSEPLRPGDRVQYRSSRWAGMEIVDVLEVTPPARADLSR